MPLASERFHEAITLDPNRPHAYVNLGASLDAQGKYYEAISAYKNALERDNRQPMVLVNLAHTYMNQDRLRMGRNALEQAIRMDPHLAAAHEALGYCQFRLKDYEGARESYARALELDPALPSAYSGLGCIDMLDFLQDDTRTDLRNRALDRWHRSLELDPDQPRIRRLIARYRPRVVDPTEALLDQKQDR